MNLHTTNYTNTFIIVADDCKTLAGEIPPEKDNIKSIANIQFEIIRKNPYKYTSDDVIFMVFANRNELTEREFAEARKALFSKGQACFRSSPLTKRYGWGVHFNAESKIAIYARETLEYEMFLNDTSVKKVMAMRSKKI